MYSYVFASVDKTNCILYVPYGAKETYASTKGWSDFENIVEIAPTEYDFTISNAGYATIYLDYATEIPEGVEVYTAKEVDGIWLKMAQVKDVLPANTGVIVKAPAALIPLCKTQQMLQQLRTISLWVVLKMNISTYLQTLLRLCLVRLKRR